MQLRQDNVCTVLNAIKPIWPGDLPHLCSHLLASYAPVNYRGTDVSSIFVCCDSSIAHGQLPAFEDCLWSLDSLCMAWGCFIYKSLFSYSFQEMLDGIYHLQLLMWQKQTSTLHFWTPAAPFYVRSGWRMAACPVCLKTIKRGNFQEKPCFHKMLISRGVTDGTVVSEVLAAVQETSRRHVFGVRSVAGWTADFDVVSLENTYPYFAEL